MIINEDSLKDRIAHVESHMNDIYGHTWDNSPSNHCLKAYKFYEFGDGRGKRGGRPGIAICNDETAWIGFVRVFAKKRGVKEEDLIPLKRWSKGRWEDV